MKNEKKLETARNFLSGLEHCYYAMLEFEHKHKLTFLDLGIEIHDKKDFIEAYIKILEANSKED